MLQQLYYIKQYFGAKYLSLAAKSNFKTIHHSIEKITLVIIQFCMVYILHIYSYIITKL